MYLFFDTETTGKPRAYGKHWHDLDNWPRMTQLAFILYDKDGKELQSYCELIKPDGWEIPQEQFFIDNNMSTERCEKEGVILPDALIEFLTALELCEAKVAHNISFDRAIVGSELYRLGFPMESIEYFKFKPKICTMKSTTKFCRLPGARGFKWPKLIELNQILFGEGFEGAHDALEDVRATARCFFELKANYDFYQEINV